MKQYEYQGRIYSVVKCDKEDIPSHIERVSSYWTSTNVDISVQTRLLEQCIDKGITYKLVNDKGNTQSVIYGLYLQGDNVVSHLLWMRSKRLFAILGEYLKTHVYIRTIAFMPHSKDYIPFEFMVKPTSIRGFHSHNTPLIVDLHSKTNYELGRVLFEEKGLREL